MMKLALNLWNEEAGFVVSAELVLISTILVLAMAVGICEVAQGINLDLQDTCNAFGTLPQTDRYANLSSNSANSNTANSSDISFPTMTAF